MKRMIFCLAVLMVGLSVGVRAETDYAALPGYVDLQDLGLSEDVASSADGLFFKGVQAVFTLRTGGDFQSIPEQVKAFCKVW